MPSRRPDPSDVRPDVPDPVGANGSMGPPAGDERIWWRLQPGVRADDGTMARRSVVHGGSCADWPPGRHPPDWSFHTRPQVVRLLSRPDEVIPCPKCSRGWISTVR